MNLKLINTEFTENGIFGMLLDENNVRVAYTLQHAYDSGHGDGSYAPKLYPGTFLCVKGQHRLANMSNSFETYEITGVKGHTNILFHVGNFNKDSEGCVLLGTTAEIDNNPPMITNSKLAFQQLLELQSGLDSFTLTVI